MIAWSTCDAVTIHLLLLRLSTLAATQAISTAGLESTLDDASFVGTVFNPLNLTTVPTTTPSVALTEVTLRSHAVIRMHSVLLLGWNQR